MKPDHFAITPTKAAAILVVLLAIAMAPLFGHQILSIGDLENHVVRGWVLLHYGDMPGLAEYFRPNWTVVPNLAIDLHVMATAAFMSLANAARLFVAVTFVLMLAGCVLLHRVLFRRWSVWPFAVVLLLYNRLLLYGLVNYLYGSGLFLIALAAWIGWRSRPAWQRVCGFGLLALATCFAHFFAFALLGLCVGLYELARLTRPGVRLRHVIADLAVAFLAFLPSLAILVVFRPHSGAIAALSYHSLMDRIGAFAVPVIYQFAPTAVGAAVMAVPILLLVRGAWRVDLPMAIVCFVLLLVQMVMPDKILTAQGADHRIPVALICLMVCAVDFTAVSQRLALAFCVVVLGLDLARSVQVERHWRADDAIYAEVLAALDALPPGTRVATAYPPDTAASVAETGIAMYYLPVWSVIPRGGFTQTLYAIPTQHPLVMQPRWRELAESTPPGAVWDALVSPTPQSCNVLAALREYDDVILLAQREPPAIIAPFLSLQATGTTMRLYRVSKTPAAC